MSYAEMNLEYSVVSPTPLSWYRGYLVRHPAPPELAINPSPYKYNEPRYLIRTSYETSEARKRRESP